MTPEELRYTAEHEWARAQDGDGTVVRIGITDYAQDALGDVVYVAVPTLGVKVAAGQSFSEIESTKSVSDIFAPISGTIADVNESLADSPQRVNEDPYGAGWLCVIDPDDTGELDALLDAAGYQALIDG